MTRVRTSVGRRNPMAWSLGCTLLGLVEMGCGGDAASGTSEGAAGSAGAGTAGNSVGGNAGAAGATGGSGGLGGSAGAAGSGAAGSGGTGASSGSAGTAGSAGVGGSAGMAGAGGTTGGTAGAGGSAGVPTFSGVSCATPPPAGAATPPPPKAYGGTCPVLVSGRNTISSGGKDREFLLIFPEDIQAGEQLPVAFLWHWLNASANSFATKGEVQAAANQQRFIAIIPEADDNALNVFTWPYTVATPSAAIQTELGLFDDLLSCVSQEFATNLSCVSSIGVSAGALWTVVLTGNRSEYLSSAIVLSGGTDVAQVKSYVKPTRKVPELVLWGGPADQCVTINFQTASHNLEQHLSDDGHFMLECVHNCAHTEPPFEPPSGGSKYTGLWQFWLDHPYWLPAGQSPYLSDGIPAATPEWCAIGAGNATPRTGMCEPADCPF